MSALATVPVQQTSPLDADHTRLGRALALAGGLVNTIRLSRTLAESGREIDLAGLDGVIGLLCAKVLDLPPDQGRSLLPELGAVLDEIEKLSSFLEVPDEPAVT